MYIYCPNTNTAVALLTTLHNNDYVPELPKYKRPSTVKRNFAIADDPYPDNKMTLFLA
jgi:hypothetical protein